MGFPPGYDNPEIEIHLVISVKTGQKSEIFAVLLARSMPNGENGRI